MLTNVGMAQHLLLVRVSRSAFPLSGHALRQLNSPTCRVNGSSRRSAFVQLSVLRVVCQPTRPRFGSLNGFRCVAYKYCIAESVSMVTAILFRLLLPVSHQVRRQPVAPAHLVLASCGRPSRGSVECPLIFSSDVYFLRASSAWLAGSAEPVSSIFFVSAMTFLRIGFQICAPSSQRFIPASLLDC